jgi:esterase/lipase superfamily enzyme
MATTVYFCTNRNPVEVSVPNNFGTDVNPNPAMVTYGRTTVTDITREGDLSDRNIAIDAISAGGFSKAIADEICNGDARHLIISVHGFDYRFREALMRTAWLQDWFHRGTPSLDTAMVLFSWPSLGSLSPEAYGIDWQRATSSAGAFRMFFLSMLPLIERFRKRKNTRVSLMAHSMGNHALAAGLGATIGDAPGQYQPGAKPVFDRILLIAADEASDALSQPAKFGRLGDLAKRSYVYYNNQDVPLSTISRHVHGVSRLGIDGPPDKPSFRDSTISFINCSAANPGDSNAPVDPQGHQYYRLVEEVRDDICAMLDGSADSPLPNRTYRKPENFYRLDCKPRPRAERFFP